ncbi:MAG: hypothetical protein V1743_01640 [Nanoarchaeota archaeon]
MAHLAREMQGKQKETGISSRTGAIPDYVDFPSAIFKDRQVAVLEIMVEYLKKNTCLSYHQIAKLLNRDERTIWTAYHRVEKKRATRAKVTQ